MPERNLVAHRPADAITYLIAAICLALLFVLTGCSRLQDTNSSPLLPPSKQVLANQGKPTESARNYLGQVPEKSDSHEARIVGLYDTKQEPVLKLKARTIEPPAPPIPGVASKTNEKAGNSAKLATNSKQDSNAFSGSPIDLPVNAAVEFLPEASNLDKAPRLAKIDPQELTPETNAPTVSQNDNQFVPNDTPQQTTVLVAKPVDSQVHSQAEKLDLQPDRSRGASTKLEPLMPLLPIEADKPSELDEALVPMTEKTAAPSKKQSVQIGTLKAEVTSTKPNETIRLVAKADSFVVPEPKLKSKAKTSTNSASLSGIQVTPNMDEAIQQSPKTHIADEGVDEPTKSVQPETNDRSLAPEVKPIDSGASKESVPMLTVTPEIIIQEEPELLEENELSPNQFESDSISTQGDCENKNCDPRDSTNNFSPLTNSDGDNPDCKSDPCIESNSKSGCPESSTQSIEAIPVDSDSEIQNLNSAHKLDDTNSFIPPPVKTTTKLTPSHEDSAAKPENTDAIPQQKGTVVSKTELPTIEELDRAYAANSSSPPNSPVKPIVAVENQAPPKSLKEQLESLIADIQTEAELESNESAKNGLEVNLQLLKLMNRQVSQLDQQGRMINNDQKRSLQHQLDALSTMLMDPQTRSGAQSRESLNSLQQAVDELRSLAELEVTNGVFCTQISGFGKFKPFPNSEFNSSQKLLIYCEVNNQKSIPFHTGSGTTEHRTRLVGHYAIYDQEGQVVQKATFAPIEDRARNRRRDFYLYFPIQLNSLKPGEYDLTLMIEDTYGSKTASLDNGIFFTVR